MAMWPSLRASRIGGLEALVEEFAAYRSILFGHGSGHIDAVQPVPEQAIRQPLARAYRQ